VHQARAPEEADALATLADPAFDPAREVLLPAAAGPGAVGLTSGADPLEPAASAARIVSRQPDTVAAEVDLAAPGWLVVVDGYDPGWTARVDGLAAPLLRANMLFKAVPVPAGHHHVDMRYRSPLMRLSAVLSGSAVAGGLALAAARRRRAAFADGRRQHAMACAP